MDGTLAEALDHPAADREGRGERDLLRRDRGDQRLERIRRDRRPVAAQPLDDVGELGVWPARRTRTRPGRSRGRAASRRPARSPRRAARRRRLPAPTRSAPRARRSTRWRPPSCQRFARSGPKRRKRSVESAKSYGSGIGSSGTAVSSRARAATSKQVVERLVRHTLGSSRYSASPARAKIRSADERGAAVGVAVADVDERLRREPGALAPVAADRRTAARGSRARASRRAAGRSGSRRSSTSTPSRASSGRISSSKPLDRTSGS